MFGYGPLMPMMMVPMNYTGLPGNIPYTSPGQIPFTPPGGIFYSSPGGIPFQSPGGIPYTNPGGIPYTSPGGVSYTSPGGIPYTSPGGIPATNPGPVGGSYPSAGLTNYIPQDAIYFTNNWNFDYTNMANNMNQPSYNYLANREQTYDKFYQTFRFGNFIPRPRFQV